MGMTAYELNVIEDDIMDSFRKSYLYMYRRKKVYIESGAANDEIIDYELELRETSTKKERTVSFRTSGCIFPKVIRLSDYDNVELEEFNGNLFVHVL